MQYIILKRRPSAAAVLPLVLAMVSGAAPLAAEDTPGGKTPFHIQAHRGAGIEAPENTLESFQSSWQIGVTPEADLRTTADGVIVCFHDPDLSRVVSNVAAGEQQQAVEDLPWSKVQALEVGSFRGEEFAGQHVPALDDVFAAMRDHPERLLYLDIKTARLEPLIELIGEHEVAEQVIFTSSKYPLIREWHELVPESMTLLWNRGDQQKLTAKLESLAKSEFKGITHFQVHVFVQDLTSDEPFEPPAEFLRSMGEELASRGIVFQVLPWECSDARAYQQLLELGVDSFATDYPQLTVETVRQHQQSHLDQRGE